MLGSGASSVPTAGGTAVAVASGALRAALRPAVTRVTSVAAKSRVTIRLLRGQLQKRAGQALRGADRRSSLRYSYPWYRRSSVWS